MNVIKGKLIAIEGLDGSGKSTQARILAQKITEKNILCFLTREPSDGDIGKLIKEALTNRKTYDKRALSSLFVADRLDHILNQENGFIHRINSSETIICDRYYFSNYAYDSNNVSLEWLSREFYISARTLEDIKKNENINKNDFIGKVVNKEVLLKMEKSKLRTPIIFNYSFAIELILKAILIKSKPNLFITENREVKFNHKTIYDEIFRMGIAWEKDEEIIINNLVDYVTFGKYPAEKIIVSLQDKLKKIKPYDLHSNWSYGDTMECFEILKGIYEKLNEHYAT